MRRVLMVIAALGAAAGLAGGAAHGQAWREPPGGYGAEDGPPDPEYQQPYDQPAYDQGAGDPGYQQDYDQGDDQAQVQPVRYRRHAPIRRRGESAAGLEAQVLAEINEARMHPARYAARLRAYRANYHGRVVREPGDEIGVQTNEGVAALDEAIAYVERRKPLRPLSPNSRLARSAARLAQGEGPTGIVGHIGPDGLTPAQRMKQAGVWAGITEENISFGQSTAEAVVRQLIIDDGVPSRGHRTSIFEPGLSAAGVSCGPHVRYGWMCVLDFAGALASR